MNSRLISAGLPIASSLPTLLSPTHHPAVSHTQALPDGASPAKMRTLLLGFACLVGLAPSAEGALLTYTLSGVFSIVSTGSAPSPILEPVSVGDTFTAVVTLDTSAPDSAPALGVATYTGAVVDIGLTSHTFTGDPTSEVNYVQIENQPADVITILTSFTGPQSFTRFFILLVDSGGTLVTSTAFPLTLEATLAEHAVLDITAGPWRFLGDIDSVTVSESPSGTVPEPSSMCLVGLGLAALARTRRVRLNTCPLRHGEF